ncbi:MAG TPA: glycosyltransferase family 4 protein [Steroidobacteraceae bacterium]|nr:glycosyltransferase family 4 protein [Steroidobacteraceae bacterium]
MPKVTALVSNAVLLGYDLNQPSFRHRMGSIVERLEATGWQVRTERLPSGRYGLRMWEPRALFAWADVVVLHQIKLSAMEARLLSALSRHRVFDLDDAIYVRKPRRLGEPPHDSRWRRAKFAATCRSVDVVVCGNEVLAGVARPLSRAVEVLPTSIDITRYLPSRAAAAESPTIVWIGSPENLLYLELIRPALEHLTARYPDLKVRVICSAFPEWPKINVERIPWSPQTEAASLAEAHIGVMPLSDDAWARGKCAFKLLQYMAAALPCVASPVGANTEAVIDGFNGFHATTAEEWERALERLIESAALRAQQGANGHAHAAEHYAMHAYRARYVALLGRLAGA